MERSCLVCGVALPKPPRGRPPKYCSGKCRKRMQRSGGAGSRPSSLACAMCGETFTPKSTVNAYCSRQCYQAGMTAAQNRRYNEDPEYRRRKIETSRRRQGIPVDLPYEIGPRSCATCGNTYTPLRAKADTRFCSRHCRDTSPEARQRGREKARRRRSVEREPYRDEEIFERDGWKCGLCGKRIGRSYRWPHPRSVSIDHIVPLDPAQGGADVRANVQAAHLECNVSKCNRGGNEQLALIG